MAYTENAVRLIGNIGRIDLKMREGIDKQYAVLNIATNENWKKDGEQHEKTVWHRVVVFAPRTVKFIDEYLATGRYVSVKGSLDYYNYEDESGNKTYVTQVLCHQFDVLDRKPDSGEPAAPENDE